MDNKRKIVFGPDVSFAGSEAYKLLRTNLMFALPTGKKCQMIGVTSSMRGEGKSTTALNLAYTIAQNGEKVLLVDADMRLPSIYQKLGIENGKGLSNILAGMTSLESVLLKPEGDRNFSLILAGDIPPNPSELLNSKNMDKYLEMWAYYFDYIIFDFPPVGVVTDALVMAEKLDGMIVVVRQDYCDTASLAETMRQPEFLKVKILGFVLNCGDTSDNKYKYKNRYGYGYYKKPYRNDYYSEYKADKGEPMLAFDKNSSSDADGGGVV